MQDNKQSYYIANTKFSRIALSQVYEILIEYEDGIDNVPENLIRFLDDNRDKDYEFDYDIPLEKGAENLLVYIYMKYLATEEERIVLENMAKIQMQERQVPSKTDIFNLGIATSEQEEKILIMQSDRLQEEVQFLKEEKQIVELIQMEYKKTFWDKIKNMLSTFFKKK